MAAQLPPLPSPRSRQTEPPRVGLGRFKKLGRFYFAALAGAPLCLLLLQLAAGLGPHRQVILRAHTTVRHSAACAVAQREAAGTEAVAAEAEGQQRQRGRERRAPAGGARCGAAAASASPAAPPTAGTLPTRHTACQIIRRPRHTRTPQHSEAALFANWTHARRTYAEVAPPWAVAVDEHAAVPRVDALRRSVGDRVSEQQNILRTKIPLRSHSGALNVRLGRTPASMNISSASGTSSTDIEPSRIG